MNALSIANLRYRYPDGTDALREVSLEVPVGMRLALVGGNGSGKSTLLLNIAGLLDGAGDISLMGVPRTKKTMPALRRRIGYLFSQVEYQFIMPSVRLDVALSLEGLPLSDDEKRDRAAGWVARLGLADKADRYPLDLSAGEMKRAALAAILAREPELLLLDEPLNSLDRRGAAALIDILKGVDTTMVIATHRRFIVEELATHVAVLERGSVVTVCERAEALSLASVRELLL